MSVTSMCLVLVIDDAPSDGPRILLGHKHTGFGAGKVVGLGGHVEPGETPQEAAIREANEEAGVTLDPDHTDMAGLLRFRFPAEPAWDQDVHVFTTRTWSGVPTPSDEITPAWYRRDDLPYDRMWDDDRYWLADVLDGHHVDAVCTFADDNQTVATFVPSPSARMGDLFEPEPERWGLRGDPYAWRALRDHLDAQPVPADADEGVSLLLAAFREVTGADLGDPAAPEMVYVEAFAHGGMSSGHVHLPTWRDELIPLLVRRAGDRTTEGGDGA